MAAAPKSGLGSGKLFKTADSMPALPHPCWSLFPAVVHRPSLLFLPLRALAAPSVVWEQGALHRGAPVGSAHTPHTGWVAACSSARWHVPSHLHLPHCHQVTSLGHSWGSQSSSGQSPEALAWQLFVSTTVLPCDLFNSISPIPLYPSRSEHCPSALLRLPSSSQLCTSQSPLAVPAPAFSLWGIIGISEEAAPETLPP